MTNNTGYPVLDFIFDSGINGIPVGKLGIILSDLSKMRFLVPKDMFPVVIIIYRFSENIWSIFDLDGKLIGSIYSTEKGTYVAGKAMLGKSGEWVSNLFTRMEPLKIEKMEEVIAKKFDNISFVYQKI